MLIQVQETHPPKAGGKVAHVVAKDGQRFEIWPDRLGGIHVGQRYDIEVEARDYQGRTFHKIIKAVPVNGAAHPTTNQDGAARAAGNGNGRASAAAGSISTEAAFVRDVLAALILKGEVPYTKRALYDATELLRGLYGATFGTRGNGHGGDHGSDS